MNELNALLQRVINDSYTDGRITDSEADALQQRFLGDWVED